METPAISGLDACGRSGNVISLEAFRHRGPSAGMHHLFYLTDEGRWLESLRSFQFLRIHPLQSELELKCRFVAQVPDLVLIESSLRWGNPLDLIELAHSRLDVPVVMLCSAADIRRRKGFLKEAFSRGLTDKITTPVSRDEVWETLEVLLRFRRQASLF